MSGSDILSKRSQQVFSQCTDDSVCAWDLYVANPYSHTNDDGFISLAYAENKLIWPEVKEWYCGTQLDQVETLYDYTFGGTALRKGFANLLENFTSRRPLPHNNFVAGDGALAVLESVCFSLFDAGDAVALLLPCYTQHRNVLTHRNQLAVVEADSLAALLQLVREKKVRGVIFTNPSNPQGTVYGRREVEELVRACAASQVHLVSDEIYAGCVFRGATMVSVVDFLEDEAVRPFTHLVSGLAKMGWSGAKVGFLYTEARQLRTTMRALSRLAPIATPSAALATRMLQAGPAVLRSMVQQNARILGDQYARVSELLERAAVPYMPAHGGLTVCLDLRAVARRLGDGFAGEERLHEKFVQEARIHLASGRDFGFSEAGVFRMTFAEPLEEVAEAVRRLEELLSKDAALGKVAARESYLRRIRNVWNRTDLIFGLLTDEAFLQRPIELRHPIIFYVGHLVAFLWNQLTVVVPAAVHNVEPVDAELAQLFERGIDPDVDDPEKVHSNSAGVKRSEWPSLERVRAFRDSVRERVPQLLDALLASTDKAEKTFELCYEHETMHQETLLYMLVCLDLKYFREGAAADLDAVDSGNELSRENELDKTFAHIPANKTVPMGADANKQYWGWDNEFPEVVQAVDAFSIRKTPITNGEFLVFVKQGNYSKKELWDEEDWAWVQKNKIEHPVHWLPRGEEWSLRLICKEVPLTGDVLEWPVQVSAAEARAYCRALGDGSRLPTEAEWYHAAYSESTEDGFRYRQYPWGSQTPTHRHGNFGFARWHATPVNSFGESRSYWGLLDLVGNGWEWTSTPFSGFPGFEPLHASYPNYSADFFEGKHFVLRGGSFATSTEELRRSFRNWYQGRYRYTFSKFRPARPIRGGRRNSEGTIIRLEAAASEEETRNQFAAHVVDGLSRPHPVLSSLYFYDTTGSQIYEEITQLEEYYLTRTEHSILHQCKGELAEILTQEASSTFNLVELGCGDGHKTQTLISHFLSLSFDVTYYPIDISEGALHSLQKNVQCPQMCPLVANNLVGLSYVTAQSHNPSLVLFLGSSIGNFDEADSVQFLARVQANLRVGDFMLCGFDLKKDLNKLHAAYFDSKGVTSRFNMNLLSRMNNELGSDFRLEQWKHVAIWNPNVGAMESWLIPQEDVSVKLGPIAHNKQFHFRAFEGIRVERSHKYSITQIYSIAKGSGFKVARLFEFGGYCLALLRKE